MAAIAAYRTAVLALLDDASAARYTTAQIDAAIRQALLDYQAARPLLRTYNIDGQDTYQIVLPADFTGELITAVTMDDDSDPPTRVTFYAFRQDEQWTVETRSTLVSSSQSVNITYALPHIIDGLDSGAGTTIPAADEQAVQIGSASYAAQSRAVSRSESINMQPEVSAQLLKLAEIYMGQFRKAIQTAYSAPAMTTTPEFRTDVF